jgi:predicted dehydrogenase
VIDSGVDIVLLCTPPGFRPAHFKAAVEAGKHVFLEKPIAVDATGVRQVIETSELARKKGLAVVAGTVFRHYWPHVEAIRQIHDGSIGEIVAGHSYYNVNGLWHKPRQPHWTDAEFQLRNWLYFTWLSGDLIVEQNVHRSDIMNWVMQATPVAAYGMGGRQSRIDPMYGYVYDHFCIEYEYPGGVKVINQCRQIDGCDTRVTEIFTGTKGTAQPDKGPVTDKRTKLPSLAVGYVQEHIDLIKSIEEGEPLNEGRQVAESTLTAIMGRMSAYTGKVVTWEQAMNSKEDLFPKELAFGPMPVPPVPMPGKMPLI